MCRARSGDPVAAEFKYVYGPVPSRRLGRSLGIDLVPLKTCTYDCVYCQLGRTPQRTLDRAEYVPLDEVLAEIEQKLPGIAPPDYITLSGSGEPTLYSRMAELVAEIKKRTAVPVAVITNASLLWNERVRESILDADLVVPSLDAGDASLWRHVNRPHPDLAFEAVVAGLRAFRERFAGRLWLEVLLLDGVTGIPSEVRKIASLAATIGPDRVQLNTVARPAAESCALPGSRGRLAELANMFEPPAEVIAEFRTDGRSQEHSGQLDEILDLLKRRPCSLKDVADGLGVPPNEVLKLMDELQQNGQVSVVSRQSGIFYTAGSIS